ncbi:MAG TPA: DUF2019 domain-containing protein [Stellaceae bacterium]|jgi:hypothetical protein|nr:DUF2019 domain-containing protein [Stellaceae bacterium]
MIADLKSMSLNELVDYFADTAVAEEEAILGMTTDMDDPTRPAAVQRNHELYDELVRIDAELRSRGRAARLALMKLYDHPNAQVNLQAAYYTLGVMPAAARERIKVIADSEWPPQYWQARSIISALESGNFKPD